MVWLSPDLSHLCRMGPGGHLPLPLPACALSVGVDPMQDSGLVPRGHPTFLGVGRSRG